MFDGAQDDHKHGAELVLGLRAFFIAGLFVAGILTADQIGPGFAGALSAGGAGVAALLLAWVLQAKTSPLDIAERLPPVRGVAAALLIFGVVAVGFCDLGLRKAAYDSAFLPRLHGQRVELQGRATSDPVSKGAAMRISIRVRVAGERPIREKVALTVYGHPQGLEVGRDIKVQARIKRLEKDDPFDSSLRRKGIVAKATASAGGLRVTGEGRSVTLKGANIFRDRFSGAARDALAPGRAALLLGLVIGDDRAIPDKTTDDFRAAGLSHLTAVSGANLAMVLAPLMFIMAALRIGRRSQVALGLFVIVMFTVVTRWEPSVLRAAVMSGVALAAFVFGRRSHAIHGLAIVFMILVAIDPMMLWSIGFQLSFGATAGILIGGPMLLQRMEGLSLVQPLQEGAGLKARAGRIAIESIAIGIAAQAAVLPLLAWHFGRISLVAVAANLFAFPLVAPATVIGLVGGLVSLASSSLAAPLLSVSGLFVGWLEWVSRTFGGSTYAQIEVPGWKSGEMISAYLVIVAGGLWLARQGRWARWPAMLAAVALVGTLVVPAAGAGKPAGMRVTFFDVGQGDAALVESAAGASVLIDGGPDPDFISARLRRRGVNRIDLVVASHAHADHVVGLHKVLDRFTIREAMDPGVDDPLIGQVEGPRKLQAVVQEETMKIGDLSVQFLAPGTEEAASAEETSDEDGEKEGSVLNDTSVVMRLSTGRDCVLFTGDIEEAGQQSLLESYPERIRCTLLKAPHHGSGRLLADFVRKVDPEYVAISVGQNDYGHPTNKALSIFERAGARILRTDRLGDVEVEMNPLGAVHLPN